MANVEVSHESVLGAGGRQSRLARVYAESLFVAAQQDSAERAEEVGTELTAFARDVTSNPDVANFIASPVVGKKKKAAVLDPALKDRASDLLRGLIGVLAQNNRLDLLRQVSAAYRQLLDERSGRVHVKVTAAVELSDAQKAALVANLKTVLGNQEPVLDIRVDPDLLGGLVVQVGDSVVDTSVRTRLQSLRSLLLSR